MDYTVLHIAVSDDEQAEILTAELADFPFESFETEDGLLKAYIPAVRLSGCKTDVDALLARRGVEGRYAVIPTQNWNASWESDFPPVDVEGRLRIRAPFHDPAPAGEMEAVVLPRMSFGTGHHATTWLMSRAVLGLGVAGRTGLDMGSGTGPGRRPGDERIPRSGHCGRHPSRCGTGHGDRRGRNPRGLDDDTC